MHFTPGYCPAPPAQDNSVYVSTFPINQGTGTNCFITIIVWRGYCYFFLSFQLWWSLRKKAVVIKAETIRKNELNPQLLPASLTSRKLGQLMSIGGPTSWVISSFCFRLLLWPSVITPCSRHTSGETKLFKMRWIKEKKKIQWLLLVWIAVRPIGLERQYL